MRGSPHNISYRTPGWPRSSKAPKVTVGLSGSSASTRKVRSSSGNATTGPRSLSSVRASSVAVTTKVAHGRTLRPARAV